MTIYDVALSFAGEQRDYVERVAFALRKEGVRLFYDEFEKSRLWGRDLAAELDRVYRKEARCVVLFISSAYRDKKWTRHELRSTLSTAIEKGEGYVLPVRFDQTDLAGLPPSMGYIDAAKTKPAGVAKLLLQKLALQSQEVEYVRPGEMILNVWRILGTRGSRDPFSGYGASLIGGRWNLKGTRVVYAASSLCVAVLETASLVSDAYTLIDRVVIGAKIALTTPPALLRAKELPADWRAMPASASTQALGSKWADSGTSAVLSVPSVTLPAERIYVLNPTHPDFASLTVFSEEPFRMNLPGRGV